ncbi:Protein of unknown function [Gryllus bimaculatus]|nr:Protein of unknown function [Gryllus bimaculatus]
MYSTYISIRWPTDYRSCARCTPTSSSTGCSWTPSLPPRCASWAASGSSSSSTTWPTTWPASCARGRTASSHLTSSISTCPDCASSPRTASGLCTASRTACPRAATTPTWCAGARRCTAQSTRSCCAWRNRACTTSGGASSASGWTRTALPFPPPRARVAQRRRGGGGPWLCASCRGPSRCCCWGWGLQLLSSLRSGWAVGFSYFSHHQLFLSFFFHVIFSYLFYLLINLGQNVKLNNQNFSCSF